MTIFAPKSSPTVVASFLRTADSEKPGYVTCFPIYGGFQLNIPENVFAENFTAVPQEQYEALLQQYEPIQVCFDSVTCADELMSGFTNGKRWNGWECPVFTREEVVRASSPDIFGALRQSEYSQIIWHEETDGFFVVSGNKGDLPEDFDIAPYLERVLTAESENFYDDVAELEISLCRPFEIRVGSETVKVYDINTQGWCWDNAKGLTFDENGQVIDPDEATVITSP